MALKLHLGCGTKHYDENYHYVAFDFNTMSASLQKIGFTEIKEYDWKQTEHSHVDDFSKAYIPHMDQTGMLMSLNIEAKK
jgi:hypothetical protein